jgi:HK97 family phage major capsid protein
LTGTYNEGIFRVGIGAGVGDDADPLVPEPLSLEIIQELPTQSAALSLCRRAQMSTKTQRLPVLDVLPTAYWVGGDTGLKQTTQQEWKNVFLVAEELAVLVPIPKSYLDDAGVPLWNEIRPRLVEALGKKIDEAVFWGTSKPSTWGPAIFPQAYSVGNVVTDGTGDDFGQDVAALGELMSLTGYTVNGFAGRPGLNWRLIGIRSAEGIPIFSANTIAGNNPASGGSLYGYPISMPNNGSWDATKAQLLGGDFSKALIAVRQDITFDMFDQGVISDDSGAVVLNLMQQDAVAIRLVMRLAYVTANPVTVMEPDKAITARFPFGVVTSSGYAP